MWYWSEEKLRNQSKKQFLIHLVFPSQRYCKELFAAMADLYLLDHPGCLWCCCDVLRRLFPVWQHYLHQQWTGNVCDSVFSFCHQVNNTQQCASWNCPNSDILSQNDNMYDKNIFLLNILHIRNPPYTAAGLLFSNFSFCKMVSFRELAGLKNNL